MKNRKLVRVLAIALAVLLAGGTVASALFSALAEDGAAQLERDHYEIEIVYMEEQQALHVTQLYVYLFRQAFSLDRVAFSAAGNLYRRESALPYDADALAEAFPEGYVPSGIELIRVEFNGTDADWGYLDANETALRAACDLAPGESGEFLFEYYLLLSRNCSMLGEYRTDVRLSGFYFAPGLVNETDEEFVVNAPVSFTRWLLTTAADYEVTLQIPENYLPAATGAETLEGTRERVSTWRFEAENVREFALSFGKRWRESTAQTASGVTVRLLSNRRDDAGALEAAVEAIELYEEWLGAFPLEQIDIAQSDAASAIRISIVRFPRGHEAGDPLSAWRSSTSGCAPTPSRSPTRGCPTRRANIWRCWRRRRSRATTPFWPRSTTPCSTRCTITIPGGLTITTSADLFTADEYALIVRGRGAAVMHELRLAMGREEWIAGIRQCLRNGAGQPPARRDGLRGSVRSGDRRRLGDVF